jgi:hypothetical protein
MHVAVHQRLKANPRGRYAITNHNYLFYIFSLPIGLQQITPTWKRYRSSFSVTEVLAFNRPNSTVSEIKASAKSALALRQYNTSVLSPRCQRPHTDYRAQQHHSCHQGVRDGGQGRKRRGCCHKACSTQTAQATYFHVSLYSCIARHSLTYIDIEICDFATW